MRHNNFRQSHFLVAEQFALNHCGEKLQPLQPIANSRLVDLEQCRIANGRRQKVEDHRKCP